MLRPRRINLEASTICQLSCPSCPNTSGEIGKKLGNRSLKFSIFKEIMEKNPWIYSVQLSNWGEIFLNNELGKIIEYSYKNNIALSAGNGANLNTVPDDVLEALVKYKFRKITCAIDGVTQEAYSTYRINGKLDKVIGNIEKINKLKEKYNSFFPVLVWQIIPFGHNEHEIEEAMQWAHRLNMFFNIKLSWDDLYVESFSPVKNTELIKKLSGLGVATRRDYRKKYNKEYMVECCLKLWNKPQINYDGRFLGCSINFWGDYGNVLEDGLEECLNSEKANYARDMLMGKRKERKDIPCISCKFYKWKKENNRWIRKKDIRNIGHASRKIVFIQNRLFNYRVINGLAKKLFSPKNFLGKRLK